MLDQLEGLDTGEYVNSLSRNNHTYNICKFYKMNFYLFKRLKRYNYVVWIDGSLHLHNPESVRLMYNKLISGANIIIFEQSWKTLKTEVTMSSPPNSNRYMTTMYNNQPQPFQDVHKQYEVYLDNGYKEELWRALQPHRPFYGLWATCMMAYNMQIPNSLLFLRNWYFHNLRFTTVEQVSLPFISQMLQIFPYSLPDEDIRGTYFGNSVYSKKVGHGIS